MEFNLIENKSNGTRLGSLKTAHGDIHTPFFMPVGTVGSVKGVSPQELKDLGAEIVLSNTYHLYLRPGEKLIKKMGGLHNFMRWDGPILTDSGGYQVFSLGKKTTNEFTLLRLGYAGQANQTKVRNYESSQNNEAMKPSFAPSTRRATAGRQSNNGSLVKITEDGVEFTSHLDGSKHFFTPEKVIDIQLDMGVDILMPLDVCPSGKASRAEIEEAVRLTIEWARRSKRHFAKKLKSYNLKANKPALFGIIQGGLDAELRKYCADELIKLDFDGYAVGGLAVDHETRDMWKIVKLMEDILPVDKPRYLMGVGTPDDIMRATHLGMDMFDCVLPTRLARHGAVFVRENGNPKSQTLNPKQIQNPKSKIQSDQFVLINLLNSKFRTDGGVIEVNCGCPSCAGGFSRAYISHLLRSNEILGLRLATLHNLYVYLNLMKEFIDCN